MISKIVYIAMGIVLMGTALFTSCSPVNRTVPNSPTNNIVATGEIIGSARDSLNKTTIDIDKHARAIEVAVPPAIKPQVTPHTTAILQDTAIQGDIVKQLADAKAKAELAIAQSKKLEEYGIKEHEERVKAESNVTQALKQRYTAVSIFCFVGVLVCGGLVAAGQKWAITVGIVCAVGCAAAIFIIQTVSLIPWVVGGFIVVAVGVAIHQFITKNGKINVLNTATTDLTKTVEAIKPKMAMVDRKKFFGDGPYPGDVLHIQSPTTQALVASTRPKLANLAPPVIPTMSKEDGNAAASVQSFRSVVQEEVSMPAIDPLAPQAKPRGFGGKRKIGGTPTVTDTRIILT
jgi:low affinity Fe/Cu permease